MMISKIKILGLTAVVGILGLGGTYTLGEYGGMGGVGQPDRRTRQREPTARMPCFALLIEIEGVLTDLDRRNLDLRRSFGRFELRSLHFDPAGRENAGRDQASIRAAAGQQRLAPPQANRDRPISRPAASSSFAPNGAIESPFTTADRQDKLTPVACA